MVIQPKIVSVKVTQLCLTLCDPMDCGLPGYSVHGILQTRVLKWVAIPFSKGSSQFKDWTWVSCNAGGFFFNHLSHQRNSFIYLDIVKYNPENSGVVSQSQTVSKLWHESSWTEIYINYIKMFRLYFLSLHHVVTSCQPKAREKLNALCKSVKSSILPRWNEGESKLDSKYHLGCFWKIHYQYN